MKISVEERDIFDISGPKNFSHSQWSEPSFKRVAMACLPQTVYVMEKDRQLNKLGIYALAPKWWIPLKYKPIKIIHDEEGEQIVGAVFRWSRKLSPIRPSAAPKVVVAFRGTMPSGDSLQSDLTADLLLIFQQLHTAGRFSTALGEIRQAINEYGAAKVAITGHSLGAALCLLAGRTLAEEGCNVDTHLFSPPFASPPLETIKNHKWQMSLQVLRMVAVAGLAALIQDEDSRKEAYDAFLALKNWYPHLYVNVNDPICSSYVGYFMSRQYLLRIGGGTLAQLVAPHSLRGLLQSLFVDSKPYHLIPSAHLHVIEKGSKKFLKAHGMHQWWSLDSLIHEQVVSFDVQEYKERMDMEQPR